MITNEYKLLFEWDKLSDEEFAKLAKELSIKKLRWLAMIHPDNKSRENLIRYSGIKVGKKTVINIGINLYNNLPDTIEIGERCAIAANVALVYESGPNMSLLAENKYVVNKFIKKEKIIIEDDVWIGANVVIFPGVRIGTGAIIGAGSIVAKNVPPHVVAKGNPFKIIKYFEKES